jgi:Tol biopolymer transport system component
MKLQLTLVLTILSGGSLSVALGQTYERLDVSSTGAFGNSAPQQIVMSDDGKIAAFSSSASNLVLPDDATSVDLFIRNRVDSTTVRIASNIGRPPSGEISYFNLGITGNGRWIVYSAWQGNHFDTHVYDRQLGTTTQAAPTLAEALPTGISPDARYVAVMGRTALGNTPYDAWRFDMQTGALLLASRTLQGNHAGIYQPGYLGTISADGDALAFSSRSSDLVPNDTNGASDVFVFHVSTSTVERVSVDGAGAGGDFDSVGGSISDDGSRVAFWSDSTNLMPMGMLGYAAGYVRDLAAGTTSLISQTTAGHLLEVTTPPLITADGHKVAFMSLDPTVIPGDGGAGWDIFLHEIASGVTSGVTTGAPNLVVEFLLGGISGGGRFVTFYTANPVMPNSSSTPGLYVADLGPACSTASYCTALPNSTGVAASIGSQGDPGLHTGSFTLTAANLPPNAIAIFASGTSAIDPGVTFGNGLRCIGGTLVRHGVLHASAGSVAEPQDFSGPKYAGTRPGDVLHFQCVYRDPSAGGAAFNSTDALSVTFCY